MAGNACSLIGLSTKGRGGSVSEMLPRFKNSSFTINEKGNSFFRCSNCNMVLPNFSYSDLKKNPVCPFCGKRDCFVTITRQKPVSKKALTNININKVYDEIIEYVKNNSHLTIQELSDSLEIPYHRMYTYVKKFNLQVKAGKRGRKPLTF